jgi:hypothetical protein
MDSLYDNASEGAIGGNCSKDALTVMQGPYASLRERRDSGSIADNAMHYYLNADMIIW